MKNAWTFVRLGFLAQLAITAGMTHPDTPQGVVDAPPMYKPLKVCVKTGTESGAGARGSYIKIKLTMKNNTGQTEIAEGWLKNNDLSNGAYSCEQLGGYRYDMRLSPSVTSYRIENHGSSGLGDNWQCEFIGVNYETTDSVWDVVHLNRWINTGTWVEQDR